MQWTASKKYYVTDYSYKKKIIIIIIMQRTKLLSELTNYVLHRLKRHANQHM